MALHSSAKRGERSSMDSIPPLMRFCEWHFLDLLQGVLNCQYCFPASTGSAQSTAVSNATKASQFLFLQFLVSNCITPLVSLRYSTPVYLGFYSTSESTIVLFMLEWYRVFQNYSTLVQERNREKRRKLSKQRRVGLNTNTSTDLEASEHGVLARE